MANIAQSQILSAIGTLIDGVADTGLVLTEERFVESEPEFIGLFKNLNNGTPHGWLINFAGFPEQLEDGTCDVARTLKYSLEFLYPYDSKRDGDDKNSKDRFIEAIEAVNDALNGARYLSLGSKVQHQFLKSVEDFVVRRWEVGTGSILTHYAVFELQVSVWSRY
jgi:hypothetical protein